MTVGDTQNRSIDTLPVDTREYQRSFAKKQVRQVMGIHAYLKVTWIRITLDVLASRGQYNIAL